MGVSFPCPTIKDVAAPGARLWCNQPVLAIWLRDWNDWAMNPFAFSIICVAVG